MNPALYLILFALIAGFTFRGTRPPEHPPIVIVQLEQPREQGGGCMTVFFVVAMVIVLFAILSG